jgi:hypothetical protein
MRGTTAKKFGKLNAAALEKRRQELDEYMQELAGSFMPDRAVSVPLPPCTCSRRRPLIAPRVGPCRSSTHSSNSSNTSRSVTLHLLTRTHLSPVLTAELRTNDSRRRLRRWLERVIVLVAEGVGRKVHGGGSPRCADGSNFRGFLGALRPHCNRTSSGHTPWCVAQTPESDKPARTPSKASSAAEPARSTQSVSVPAFLSHAQSSKNYSVRLRLCASLSHDW